MKKKEYIRFDRTPFKPLTKEEKEMEKIGVLLLIDSLKVKGKDNMKEKIEEIVNKYTKSPMAFADGVERVTFQERYFPISDLVKELSTLIQEERKKAYLDGGEDFARYLDSKEVSGELNDEAGRRFYDWAYVREAYKEYLESEGK